MDPVELSDRDLPRAALHVREDRDLHRRGSLEARIAPQMDRRRLLGGSLACSMLAVSACGGGSSGAQLSKSQLAAKVNAACTSYVKASSAVPQPRDITSNA